MYCRITGSIAESDARLVDFDLFSCVEVYVGHTLYVQLLLILTASQKLCQNTMSHNLSYERQIIKVRSIALS